MLFKPIFLQINMHFLNQKTECSTVITNQSIVTNKPKVLKDDKTSHLLQSGQLTINGKRVK